MEGWWQGIAPLYAAQVSRPDDMFRQLIDRRHGDSTDAFCSQSLTIKQVDIPTKAFLADGCSQLDQKNQIE